MRQHSGELEEAVTLWYPRLCYQLAHQLFMSGNVCTAPVALRRIQVARGAGEEGHSGAQVILDSLCIWGLDHVRV